MAPNPDTIIIADDHPFTVNGMKNVLGESSQLKVIGTASNGIQAIALIKRLQPNCAVVDLSMPGANGLEVFLEAKRWSPKTYFVIVTGISAASLFKQLFDAGIDGLFVKNAPPERIRDGIIRVMQGERVIAEEAMEAIKAAQKTEKLSKRELEVLRELSTGQSNKAVADKLGVSPKTIDTHRTNLLRKMKVNTTASLLVKAIKDGILDI